MPSPHHARSMQGIFLVSTDSTAQGWVFENNLPTVAAYCGYKIPSGEYVYDETEHKYPIIAVENKYDLIATGEWSNTYRSWSKVGFNPDISTAEEAVNWAGSVFWAATSGQPMRVASANNLDKVGSSGCTKVWIKYLDAMYLEQTTTVTLNGTTAVLLVDTSIARIQNFQAYEGNTPLGNIAIGPSTGGTISTIAAGYTRARNSMWTVPTSQTLYIKDIYFAAAGDAKTGLVSRVLLRTNYNESQNRYSTSLFWPVLTALLKDNEHCMNLSIPVRIPEKTDIYATAISAAASSGNLVETIFRGWVSDN